jgi:phosphatidylethanolamine/phosphatidyl-N-methylethanolamine N-methyltransferase
MDDGSQSDVSAPKCAIVSSDVALPPWLSWSLTPAWFRWRYDVLAPWYDLFAGRHPAGRRASIAGLELPPEGDVLVVGVGTGQDLELLPSAARITAIDLAPRMIERARRMRPDARYRRMDGARLELRDRSFDAVVLHQVLAVVADPVQVLREAARVLRPGGRLGIFDKFLPDAADPQAAALGRQLLSVAFTQRKDGFGSILRRAAVPLEVVRDVDCPGRFRALTLRKVATRSSHAPAVCTKTAGAVDFLGPRPNVLREGGVAHPVHSLDSLPAGSARS